ncbi:unnamed protein product [Zymoseptoria tritici ST99CH_3D1]|nr:unnamed protein product [Zymoseptoria tritici ST99CH_3D1]
MTTTRLNTQEPVLRLRHELVKCPPPSKFPATDALPAFIQAIDINDLLKGAVCEGLSMVPTAGAILSKALGILWPDTANPTLKWTDIEAGVKSLAQGLIEEHDAKDLKLRTEGLMNLLQTYRDTSYGTDQKKAFLNSLLSWFDTNKAWYCKNEEPWLTMQCFVQMATMHLSVLREQAFYWDKVYGSADPHVDAEKHKQKLRNAIAEYTSRIDKIRARCTEWRMSKVSRTDWASQGHNAFNQYKTCKVNDSFSGFDQEYSDNDETYHQAERDFQNLRDYVDITYRGQLENYLSLSLIWPNFAAEQHANLATIGRTVFMESGIAGSGAAMMQHFNDREFHEQHGPITRIDIHAWDGVDGIEVWYGGQSSGLRGKKGGSVRTIELGPGHSIDRVVAHVGKVVDAIAFRGNFTGYWAGAGGNGGGFLVEDPNFIIAGIKDPQQGDPNQPTIPSRLPGGNDLDNLLDELTNINIDFGLRLAYIHGWATGDAETRPQDRGFLQQLGVVFSRKEVLISPLDDAAARALLEQTG